MGNQVGVGSCSAMKRLVLTAKVNSDAGWQARHRKRRPGKKD